MRKWYPEHIEYLKKISLIHTIEECTNILNDYFKTNFSTYSVRRIAGIEKISFYKYNRWSKEEIDFLKENAYHTKLKDLTEKINFKFGKSRTEASVMAALSKNNIHIGGPGCFIQKGTIPKNKGKKWSDYLPKETQKRCSKGWFKSKPDYSERVDERSGAVYIKVPGKRFYESKSRYVWEQHNGKIPDGYVIVFLDKNPGNCDISNMEIVTKRQKFILSVKNLYSTNPDITRSGIALAKLIDKIQSLSREEKNK